LVTPTAASSLAVIEAFESAARIASTDRVEISTGSCSTQPGLG
jgi:hypothetical protein